MIQRIQTLFLIAAAGLIAAMLVIPLVEIRTGTGEVYSGMLRGLRSGSGEYAVTTWPLFILAVVTAALLFVNIFLFKNRKLQIRLCVYAIILGFGQIGLMYYYWVILFRRLGEASYLFRVSVVFPALGIILTYLAFRAIRKDEILIRSIDRLR